MKIWKNLRITEKSVVVLAGAVAEEMREAVENDSRKEREEPGQIM